MKSVPLLTRNPNVKTNLSVCLKCKHFNMPTPYVKGAVYCSVRKGWDYLGIIDTSTMTPIHMENIHNLCVYVLEHVIK